MIEVMNIRDEKPSQPYDFYIDRRTPVGNPYPMVREDRRDAVCNSYEGWFSTMIELSDKRHKFFRYMAKLEEAYERYGKLRLFCWCAPKRCHGDTIKRHLENKYERR